MGTLHEDVEVYDHDIPDRGEYRGHAGFGRWLRDWGAAWAEWNLEPEEFIDAGDRVIIVAHMRAKGRGSGVEVDRQDALVYELRDGKISRVDYYNRRLLQPSTTTTTMSKPSKPWGCRSSRPLG